MCELVCLERNACVLFGIKMTGAIFAIQWDVSIALAANLPSDPSYIIR